MLIIPFIVEIIILTWALKRTGFMPFPHGVMIYAVGAQAAVALVAAGLLEYQFLEAYSTYGFISLYSSVFWMFFAFFVCLLTCIPKKKVNLAKIVRSIEINPRLSYLFIGVLYVHLAIELVSINWGIVWQNSEYLLIAGESGLRIVNPITKTNHSASEVFGIFSFIALAYFIFSKQRQPAILTAPLSTWFFFISLAGHSRYAAFYLVAFATVGAVLSRSRIPALAAVSGIVGLITLISVLGGRSTHYHGLVSIPLFFENVSNQLGRDPAGTFLNVFEGAFVSSEQFSNRFEFPDDFKLLSLSPLISAIDQYDVVLNRSQVRLAPAVPAGAINEVISFGPIYAIIFFGVELWAGFLSARYLAKRSTIFAFALNAVMMLAAYLQFTYSTRIVFRLFVLVLIGASLGLRRSRPAPVARYSRYGQSSERLGGGAVPPVGRQPLRPPQAGNRSVQLPPRNSVTP